MNSRSLGDGRDAETPSEDASQFSETSESARRLQQLEVLAASATEYSPELLLLLQHERRIRAMRLSNFLVQSLQSKDNLLYQSAPVPAHAPQLQPLHMGAGLGNASTWSLPAVPYSSSTSSAAPQAVYPSLSLHDLLPLPMQQKSIANQLPFPASVNLPTDSRQQQQQPSNFQRLGAFDTSIGSLNLDQLLASKTGTLYSTDRSEAGSSSRGPLEFTASAAAATSQPDSKQSSSISASINQQTQQSPSSSNRIIIKSPTLVLAAAAAASASGEMPGNVRLKCATRRQYRTETFPSKLLRMIETAKLERHGHLIHFTADGSAVRIPQPKELTKHVFPKYFRHKNFASFQRQLSMYGWLRILEGVNKGCYAHPLFIEGRPDLIPQIKRISELELVEDAAAAAAATKAVTANDVSNVNASAAEKTSNSASVGTGSEES